jgi:hypothetical protein
MLYSIRALRRARVRIFAGATALGALIALTLIPQSAQAQTDFFNTDGARPLRVQDALSIEWRAIELQFAPLRLERAGNAWHAEVEPELAFGLFPRTHLSLGFPMVSVPTGDLVRAPSSSSVPFDGSVRTTGLSGLHMSVFHQLNVETRIPAFAVRGEVLLPVGAFAADRAYPAITGIVTRTIPALGAVRVHGNASVTFGDAPNVAELRDNGPIAELPHRWMAGVSMDRAFPLKSTLIAAEVFAQRGLVEASDVVWNAGAGVRHQVSPRIVFDVGVGRALSGPEKQWSFTVGSAVALGLGRRLF